MVKKAEARSYFLKNRQNLSEADARKMDRDILERLQEISLTGVNYLHLFLPIKSKNEVNTYLLADWLREKHPQINLVISRSNFADHGLSHIIWDEQTILAENAWGITEPQNGMEVNVELLDLILIPLLAFDKKGNRVGYGKGFYDRMLAGCRPDARKIGLSYFEPLSEIEDAGTFDIALDSCITPHKIWEF